MRRRSGDAASRGRSGGANSLVIGAVEDAGVVDPLDFVHVAGVADDGVPPTSVLGLAGLAPPDLDARTHGKRVVLVAKRVGCGAMLTRRSGSRAIGAPPRGPKSASVAIFSIVGTTLPSQGLVSRP